MRRASTIICFLGIVLSVSFCNPRSSERSLSVIDIEADWENMDTIYISRFSDDVRYIPLEISRYHILSWNTNLYVDFSKDYILDSDGKTCMLYGSEGNFIRQIGSQGRGPGEYTGIKYVKLLNDKVIVFDYMSNDLIEYKIDGTFVSRYTSGLTGDKKYRFIDGFIMSDSLIMGNIENFTGKDEYKAMIIDYEGNIKKAYRNYIFFDIEPGLPYAKSPGSAVYYKFKESVFFKEFLNDTLFKVDDKNLLTPYYVFNFGKYKLTLSDRGKHWSKIDLDSYFKLDNICETDDFLILDLVLKKYFPAKRVTPEIIRIPGINDYTQWFNTTAVTGIFDKKTGELVFSKPSSTNNHLSTSGLYNDIDAGPRFMPGKMIDDCTMVMKIRFDYLTEHIESDEFKNNTPLYPEKKKTLETFVDSLRNTGFDNPVYMVVTFNKQK